MVVISRLMRDDERRERNAMLDVLAFVARFSWPFLIGYMLGMLDPRW